MFLMGKTLIHHYIMIEINLSSQSLGSVLGKLFSILQNVRIMNIGLRKMIIPILYLANFKAYPWLLEKNRLRYKQKCLYKQLVYLLIIQKTLIVRKKAAWLEDSERKKTKTEFLSLYETHTCLIRTRRFL